MSYNGWYNKETWLVNVWFNPESREDVERARYFIEEEYDKLSDFMKDFCNINAIDWDDLLNHFDENETEDVE